MSGPVPLVDIQPGRTDRAILIGQTGTGKTTLAQFLLQLREYVVVLDPKGLIRWPGYMRITSLKQLNSVRAIRNPKIIYAPTVYELQKSEVIDEFLRFVYERRNCTLYIDEVAAIASATNFPFHLGACYMRGRERNVEVWAATQRPSRIPLICFSEAEHTYCFFLKMKVDRQRVEQDAGIPADLVRALPKREFYYTGQGQEMTKMTLNPNAVAAARPAMK